MKKPLLCSSGISLGGILGTGIYCQEISRLAISFAMSGRSETVFEFAGGQPAFYALAEAMHKRCLEDEELNHPFSHADKNPNHVMRLSHYWGEVFGGPALYSAESSGHLGVLKMHANNGEPGDLGERFYNCFLQAIEDANLPSDVDFRAALTSYMKWAVDDVMQYFPHGSTVPRNKVMPKWGWNGLIES